MFHPKVDYSAQSDPHLALVNRPAAGQVHSGQGRVCSLETGQSASRDQISREISTCIAIALK